MIVITWQDDFVQTRKDNPDEVIAVVREDGSRLIYQPGKDDYPTPEPPGGFPPPRTP
jgi:hypothetical protein